MKKYLLTIALFIFCINSWSIEASTPHKIKIALFLGAGAHPRPQIFDVLSHQPNMTLTEITGAEIRNGDLKNFDVLFIPGGSAVKESNDIEVEGRDEIRQFVKGGGIYIGVCAGSYFMSESKPIYLGLLPIKTVDKKNWKRGKQFLPIQFTTAGMNILKPEHKEMDVLYHNGPVFEKNINAGIKVLARYRDEIVAPDGEPGLMTDSPAIVFGHYGKGLVMGISPHPEASPGLEYIERNAIQWMFDSREIPQITA